MSGDYEVIVVLEREDSDKIELRVDLTLVPNPDSLRTIFIAPGIPVAGSTAPFYGFSSLDLSALEAPNLGDVDSRNPLEPGVLLIETVEGSAGEERTSVLMRLGSHANRRGQTRFDGGYFVMQVTHLERNRFTGTWTAGLIATDATGYFCASRKPSPQSN
ncbi:MAG: hypothetical protein OEY63_08210 [Gemmatimonadota bacterium]|nr:hypothetical protein [Gemmatimonadota bacterium]MDH5805129.1 hypothetical protein [Gemmatimonadota bacterium]